MTTIKSYTDIEQSRKLAKILPLESADRCYLSEESLVPKVIYNGMAFFDSKEERLTNVIHCWSLAALFGVLPILDNRSPVISKTFDRKYRVVYHSTTYEKAILTTDYDNPVDACYEMILKLHGLNLL